MTAVHDDLLLIGHIVAAFGLRGQVKLRAVTDQPDHIARHVRTLYIGAKRTPYRLVSLFEHKPGLLILSLQGVANRDAAEGLRGTEVFIQQRDAAPLGEGEYYLHELYGLRVETPDGAVLGTVREVLETGSNDVLIVARPDQSDLLLPMIRDVVEQLDTAGGRVVVRLLDGLV